MNPYQSVNLPEPQDIAQIAANLYSSPSIKCESDGEKIQKATATAISLWDEAVKQLSGKFKTDDQPRCSMEKYAQPLKIGNHFLPKLGADSFKEKNVPLKKFLKNTLGLSKHDDRMTWFRQYLNDICIDAENFAKSFYTDASCSIKTDTKKVETQLEHYRTQGVDDPLSLALAIRKWRLSKAADKSNLACPANFDDCLEAGIASEKKQK